jgi:hypothetical protein
MAATKTVTISAGQSASSAVDLEHRNIIGIRVVIPAVIGPDTVSNWLKFQTSPDQGTTWYDVYKGESSGELLALYLLTAAAAEIVGGREYRVNPDWAPRLGYMRVVTLTDALVAKAQAAEVPVTIFVTERGF